MHHHKIQALPDTIEIILAEVDHLADLAELMDQYRLFYGQASNRPAAEQFLFERIINHDSVIYLARDVKTRQAVGFVQLYPSFSSVSLQPVWILNDLYVLTDYRRLGIGRALIQQAVNLARARGDKGLTLQTMPENLPAQALYKSMGFVEDTKSIYFVNWFSENE